MTLASNISDTLHGVSNGDGFLVPCVCHEDKNPSLSIKDIINKHGDPDIVCECHAGCDWKDVKKELEQRGLLPKFKPASVKKTPIKKKPASVCYPWKQAKQAPEKIKDYFASREILFASGEDKDDEFPLPSALRFGAYKDKKTGDQVQLIVCAATKPGDDSVQAVQRIFVKENSQGHLVKDGCKMLGEVLRRGVWFYRKRDKTKLIVGEGVETTLSAMIPMKMNGVAGLDAGKMKKLVFPVETQEIYILVDQDKNFVGQAASIELAKSFEQSRAGRKAFLVAPSESFEQCFPETGKKVLEKKDFNDVLVQGGEKAVKACFKRVLSVGDVMGWTPPEKSEETPEAGGYYPKQTVIELNKMNQVFAACLLGGKYRIIKESFDNSVKKHTIDFLEIGAFHNYHANKKIFIKTKEGTKAMSLSKCWHEWPDRRTFDNVVFSPGNNTAKTSYNLFRGFPIKPKKGSWKRMRAHIEDIICQGNMQHTAYLFDWMARCVQKPGGKRPGVAVVLKGGKGVGKGIFANYFGQIFGEAFMPIASSKGFTGQFNAHLSKCLLVFLDEAVWGGDKQAEGQLKSLITEPTMLFEPKGIDSMSLCNYINVIMASNEDWVCPASIDERRFFVLNPSDNKQGDVEYFNKIIDEMEQGGAEAMYYDLMRRKYNMDDLRRVPRTAGLLEQVEQTLDDALSFWHFVLSRGFLLSDRETGAPRRAMNGDELDEWPQAAWKYEVYNEFKQNFCRNKQHCTLDKQFWKKTFSFWPDGSICTTRPVYEPGIRKYKIAFPVLSEMRNLFSAKTKITFDKDNIDPSRSVSENINKTDGEIPF